MFDVLYVTETRGIDVVMSLILLFVIIYSIIRYVRELGIIRSRLDNLENMLLEGKGHIDFLQIRTDSVIVHEKHDGMEEKKSEY